MEERTHKALSQMTKLLMKIEKKVEQNNKEWEYRAFPDDRYANFAIMKNANRSYLRMLVRYK